jgi:hypothetical protein
MYVTTCSVTLISTKSTENPEIWDTDKNWKKIEKKIYNNIVKNVEYDILDFEEENGGSFPRATVLGVLPCVTWLEKILFLWLRDHDTDIKARR